MGTDDTAKVFCPRPYADKTDNARATECLVAAYKDDAMFQHLLNGYAYERALRRLFSWTLWAMASNAQTQKGTEMEVMIDPTTNQVLCFAVWGLTAPAAWTVSGQLRLALVVLVMAVLEGPFLLTRLLEIAYILESKRKAHAPKHIILKYLSTSPESQNKGLGAQLLQAGIDRAAKAGVSCYLESSNPRNVPFFQRNGFRVLKAWYPLAQPRFRIQGPLITLMVRDIDDGDEKVVPATAGSQRATVKTKNE
jgi:GNAT superfamily N-acetyltransferase